MKIRILGSGPGIPQLDKNLSATYIEMQEKKILFDCGDGTVKLLLKNHLDRDVLDAIIISHYHPDHVSGIFITLQMLYLQGRTKPLYVFLPERIDDFLCVMKMFYTFPVKFLFPLEFKLITDITEWDPSMSAILTDHLEGYKPIIHNERLANQMHSYSLMIRESNRRIILSSDLFRINPLVPYLTDIDYLIIDALHPKAEDIIDLIPKVREKIILTHGVSDELENYLLNNPQPKVVYADEKEDIIL